MFCWKSDPERGSGKVSERQCVLMTKNQTALLASPSVIPPTPTGSSSKKMSNDEEDDEDDDEEEQDDDRSYSVGSGSDDYHDQKTPSV